MKKLLLVMLTLSTTVLGMAQSYNHDEPRYENRNGHDNYRNRTAIDHDYKGRNRTIVSVDVVSHNNGYIKRQPPIHNVPVRNHQNIVIVSNNHNRRYSRHESGYEREYRNGHDD